MCNAWCSTGLKWVGIYSGMGNCAIAVDDLSTVLLSEVGGNGKEQSTRSVYIFARDEGIIPRTLQYLAGHL